MTPTRRTNLSGAETKDRILDAALAVARVEGMLGVSARKIAKAGDFNQALVFYHFGTVEELMLAALERAGERRLDRHRERLEAVTDLRDLVRIASELHVRRTVAGTPLAQLLPAEEVAYAISALFLGIEVFDRLDPNSGMTQRLFMALEALAMLADPMLEGFSSPGPEPI